MKLKKLALLAGLAAMTSLFTACGGGGGGGSTSASSGAAAVIRYPYETVFGAECKGNEVTPGCTFVVSTGKRVTVVLDPNYDKMGYGSDDLWYVKFNSSGGAAVYDDLGNFQYNASASDFAGHISGTTIGVGTSGAYWENVANKTYWFGKNGVLYSASTGAANYGQAINNKDAGKGKDNDSFAIHSEANVKLIKAGAAKLMKSYGLSASKAVAVASALNSIAVGSVERGQVTSKDIDQTFKTLTGVPYNQALAAFKDFKSGDTAAARELTNRSAEALGLKPEEAQAFLKGMYKGALAQWGYDVKDIKW